MVAYIEKCKELGKQLNELMEAIEFFLEAKISAEAVSSLKEKLKRVEVLINSMEPTALMYVYWLYVNILPEIGLPVDIKDRLDYIERALSSVKDTLETLSKKRIFPKLPFPWDPLRQDIGLRRKLVLRLVRIFNIGYIAYESECAATEGFILLSMVSTTLFSYLTADKYATYF